MSDIIAGEARTVSLPAGSVLTVTAGVACTGSVCRLADSAGGEPRSPVDVAESTAPTFGPFAVPSIWRIECATGALADSQAPLVAFANPMTGAGELLAGGAAGVPTALANPGAGTFNLQSVDGVLTWTAAV